MQACRKWDVLCRGVLSRVGDENRCVTSPIWLDAMSHYGDVIMIAMASLITAVSIVCSIVCSDADQRKHLSSEPLAFVRGLHRWPVDSPHKGPVAREMFPLDDVITSYPADNPADTVARYQCVFFFRQPASCFCPPHTKLGLCSCLFTGTPMMRVWWYHGSMIRPLTTHT